jgi:hypothetical protein
MVDIEEGNSGRYASIEAGHFLHKLNKVSDVLLRDYFAAMAMTGLINRGYFGDDDTPKWSYDMADAMMEARKTK